MTTLTTFTTKTTSLTKAEADANFAKAAQVKTTTYTVLESDNRDTIECSGTFTVTLPAASTLTAASDTGDFEVTIKNSGSGIVTVSGSIDGLSSKELAPDQSETYKANQASTGWNIVSSHGNIVHGVTTVNAGTSVDIVTNIPSWAKKITLTVKNLEFSSAATPATVQLGDSTSYAVTGYTASNQVLETSGITTGTSTGGFNLTAVVGLSTTAGHSGDVVITNESGTNNWISTSRLTEIAANKSYLGFGQGSTTTALTRIRITSGGFDGSGTITYLIEG